MAPGLLKTAVPGLDTVLGGGLPEYSLNLVTGLPGCGKTTLVHQIALANATAGRPALYFTVTGEPPLKMLRYQQQMSFFDPEKVASHMRFVDLGAEALSGDLSLVLEKIAREVERTSPSVVIIDSIRAVLQPKQGSEAAMLEEHGFLQRLALQLTAWQVTSFLVGEYPEEAIKGNPVFAVADGIIRLVQQRERNAVVRKIDIIKVRGMPSVPGLHTFRICDQGLQVFPRSASRVCHPQELRNRSDGHRAAFGIAALDEMLHGGLPAGDVSLIAGPSGAGKTVLGTHFISEGGKRGERGVMVVFEESPDDYIARADSMGLGFSQMVEAGDLEVLYLRPLDLSADELLFRIQEAVATIGAKRLVIDSLNWIELALSPTYREDFRESLYRLVGHLMGDGVSVLMVVEVTAAFNDLSFSPHQTAFMAQNVLFLRYVEVGSQLRRMLAVIKMRRSGHSWELREYEITGRGLCLREPFREHEGVLTGTPTRRRVTAWQAGIAARAEVLAWLSKPGRPRLRELLRRRSQA